MPCVSVKVNRLHICCCGIFTIHLWRQVAGRNAHVHMVFECDVYLDGRGAVEPKCDAMWWVCDVWWVPWHCSPIICVTISSLRRVIYYWLQLGKLFTSHRRDLTQLNLPRHFIFKFDVKRRLFRMSPELTFIKYHFDMFFPLLCNIHRFTLHTRSNEMTNRNHLMKFVVASTVCKCCPKCCKFCSNFTKIEDEASITA